MPSVMAFTEEDFAPAWADAVALLPALATATIAEGMNGIFSFTPDGFPLLGEARDVRGFWIAEAVWITHGVGVGKAMAEWIVAGVPSIDLRQCDIHRFESFAHSPAYVLARSATAFIEVYDVIHPLQPMDRPRPLRTSPFHPRQQQLGAYFLEGGGWERPHWYEANAPLAEGIRLLAFLVLPATAVLAVLARPVLRLMQVGALDTPPPGSGRTAFGLHHERLNSSGDRSGSGRGDSGSWPCRRGRAPGSERGH